MYVRTYACPCMHGDIGLTIALPVNSGVDSVSLSDEFELNCSTWLSKSIPVSATECIFERDIGYMSSYVDIVVTDTP